MHPILVGIDLSPQSELALTHALALARRLDVPVTLALSTYVPEKPEGLSPSLLVSYARYAEQLEQILAEERAQLEALRQRYCGQGVELSHVVLDGLPQDELPKAAARLGASLTAVGTHGRTGFQRFSLGSVAEKIVRNEERPVLVARGPAPAGGYRRVVVGLDFSPCARKAVQAARQYLAPGGQLELVHCWQLPMWSFASGDPYPSDTLAILRSDVLGSIEENGRRWLEELGPVDGHVSFHSVEATPAAGLDAWARSREAELIVVGSHGHRGLKRWLIGSVAEATVRHAPCSVVVVH